MLNNHNDLTCPVCGYGGLSEPPYNQFGSASFDICSCCGTEFGNDDFSITFEQLRNRWITNGMLWFSVSEPSPEGWDPVTQLRACGFLEDIE
jgi:hypothetical protein